MITARIVIYYHQVVDADITAIVKETPKTRLSGRIRDLIKLGLLVEKARDNVISPIATAASSTLEVEEPPAPEPRQRNKVRIPPVE